MLDIKHYYENTDLTMQEIANRLGITRKRVFTYVRNRYSKAHRSARKRGCYARSKLGEKNPMYGKVQDARHNYIGVVSDGKGYLMALKPEWYTGRKGSKHVFVHQLIVCTGIGLTEIPAGWCVHHCDENPRNNTFGNLVLMTVGDHRRIHQVTGATTISKESTLKWVEAHGTPYRRGDMV
ncbi:MAG: HNH endonuclease [Burkholderia gladioli]